MVIAATGVTKERRNMLLIEDPSTYTLHREAYIADTGALKCYMDVIVARRRNLLVRQHALPYNPIGADGSRLPRVTQQCIAFGDHFK